MGFLNGDGRQRSSEHVPISVTIRDFFHLARAAVHFAVVLILVCAMLAPVIGYTKVIRFIAWLSRSEPSKAAVEKAWEEYRRKEFLPVPTDNYDSNASVLTINNYGGLEPVDSKQPPRPEDRESSFASSDRPQHRNGPAYRADPDEAPLLTPARDPYRH